MAVNGATGRCASQGNRQEELHQALGHQSSERPRKINRREVCVQQREDQQRMLESRDLRPRSYGLRCFTSASHMQSVPHVEGSFIRLRTDYLGFF